MPSTPRDSSILSQGGLRRAAIARPREHLPFRNDERVQGKRTGLTALYQELDSDGFEPFSAVLAQLDAVPAPAVRGKAKATPRRSSVATPRRSIRPPSSEESEEEGFEEYDVTMDADLTPPPTKGRGSAAATPSASVRVGPPSRSARKSAPRVSDFDRIPSPGRGAPPRAKPRARPASYYDEEDVPIASSGGRSRPRPSLGRRTTPFARDEEEDEEDVDMQIDSPGVSRRGHPRPSRVSLAHELERRGSVGTRMRASDAATPRPSYAVDDFGQANTSVGAASFGALSDAMDEDEVVGGDVDFPEEFHADYPPEFAEERAPSILVSGKAKRKDKGRAPEEFRPEYSPDFMEERDLGVQASGRVKKKDKGKARALTPPPEEDEEEEQDTMVVQEDMDVPMAEDDYPLVEYPPEPEAEPEPAQDLPEPEDEPMEPIEEDELPADVEDDEEEEPPKSKGKGKGKGKAKQTKEPKSKRKARDEEDENEDTSVGKKKKTQKPRSRSAKENTPAYPDRLKSQEINQHPSDDEASSTDEHGLRRGRRKRYRPLEWWRLEKVEYGRGKALAEIKRIITLPKEAAQPLGAKKRGAAANKRQKSKAPDSTTGKRKSAAPAGAPLNPEEGWDANTEPEGVVLDYVTKQELRRRVVWPAHMVHTKPAENNAFQFQKAFGDGDFLAAGQLVIPPNKAKPTKNARDNTYVFYIVEGAVRFTVHDTSYTMCQGGMVIVPRGNAYSIHNIGDRNVRIFFAQGRKIRVDEEEDPPVVSRRSRTSGASEASSGGESVGRRGSSARA